jgi:hypothetical protein
MRYTDTDLLVSVFSTVLSINSKYCKYLAFLKDFTVFARCSFIYYYMKGLHY